MNWRIVQIAAPQYVIERDDGVIARTEDGSPMILYSEQQAEAACAIFENVRTPTHTSTDA